MSADLAGEPVGPVWILLPVKAIRMAKNRLSPRMNQSQRERLSEAMLRDVLDEVMKVRGVDGVLVISNDPGVGGLEILYPLKVRPDPPSNKAGLSGAVADAAGYLRDQGVATLLVLHGDLPLVDHRELESLLASHRARAAPCVTLVPDAAGDGTNVLVATPPTVVAFAYGPGSFARHSNNARQSGVAARVEHSECLGLDIDTPDDLLRLASYYGRHPELAQRRTFQLLDSLES